MTAALKLVGSAAVVGSTAPDPARLRHIELTYLHAMKATRHIWPQRAKREAMRLASDRYAAALSRMGD